MSNNTNMQFIARIQDGRIEMSPATQGLYENFLRRIKTGADVTVEVKRVGRNKTVQQCRTHWGLVIGTIREQFRHRGMDLATLLNSPTIPDGLEVPADVIQAILYATCNDVGPNGERKTLSRMDTIEASAFFDKCRTYAASAWDVQIPDPDPAWKQ